MRGACQHRSSFPQNGRSKIPQCHERGSAAESISRAPYGEHAAAWRLSRLALLESGASAYARAVAVCARAVGSLSPRSE